MVRINQTGTKYHKGLVARGNSFAQAILLRVTNSNILSCVTPKSYPISHFIMDFLRLKINLPCIIYVAGKLTQEYLKSTLEITLSCKAFTLDSCSLWEIFMLEICVLQVLVNYGGAKKKVWLTTLDI